MVSCVRRMMTRLNVATVSLGLLAIHHHPSSHSCRAFVVQPLLRFRSTAIFQATASSLPEIPSMRIAELKQELESYGISTKSFLEKKELVQALEKARADGLEPKQQQSSTSASSSSSSSSSDSSATSSRSGASSGTSSSSSADSSHQVPREERLRQETTKCQSMTAAELKKELKERGVRTTSFFEKSEFVQALAKARVDGVKGKSDNSDNEEEVVEAKNVEVLTDDSSGPRAKAKQEQQSSPFGGGAAGSPFGGGGGGGIEDLLKNMGGMGGGMGGMGGIADMLKNMGGGGAGGSPFGGGGANPFGGDVMGKAQQLMQNPKVRELLAKAQSNPALMKKVQECMSNPMAMAKYANDPDVKELIDELKKYV